MLVALLLRVKGLGSTNIWLDEANSWRVARLPWGAMLDNLRSSPLGPLYFVLLKLWIQIFGDTEVALRAPSLLASVLLIPVTYSIGVRVFSRRAAIVGVVLLTLSPLHLYFAQEARMYMLLTLFAALYFLAYQHWRDATSAPGAASNAEMGAGCNACDAGGEPGRASRALVWYVVAGTVMIYTNVIAGTLMVALNLDAFWLLAQQRRHSAPGSRRAAVAWVAANGAITAAFMIYLLTVHFGSAGASQGWRGALGVTEAVRALFEYPLVVMHGVYYYAHDFSSAATNLQRYPSIRGSGRFLEVLLVQPLTLVTIVLALGAGAARMFTGAGRAVVLALVVPLAIGTVVSISQQLDLGRYFLFASPFLLLLIAYGLTRLDGISFLVSLAILLLTTALGIRKYETVDTRDSDYRPVANVLAHDTTWARAASAILIQPPEAAEPLSYYLRHERTAPIHAVPLRTSIVGALPRVSGARTWLVLDYRSPLYDTSPAALRDSVGADVVSDRYVAGAGGGVRLVLLGAREE